jgi:hypothetical protein
MYFPIGLLELQKGDRSAGLNLFPLKGRDIALGRVEVDAY